MTEDIRVKKLTPPTSPVSIVLDSDTGCEVDDQFALAYAIRSAELDQIRLEAVYAAPFPVYFREPEGLRFSAQEGMETSYQEIERVIGLTHSARDIPFFKGSSHFLKEGLGAQHSPAVDDLIVRAMARPEEDPLYVVCIGAITNVANALLLEPKLADHLVVLFLGTNDFRYAKLEEYNFNNDPAAFNIVADSGVPMILFPARHVVSHLITTVFELDHFLLGKSDIGSYLCSIVHRYSRPYIKEENYAWSKVIWDVVGIAFLLHPDWFVSSLHPFPRTAKMDTFYYWVPDPARPLMRCVDSIVDRDRIFTDLFAKLSHD